jgi:hypothetical protein
MESDLVWICPAGLKGEQSLPPMPQSLKEVPLYFLCSKVAHSRCRKAGHVAILGFRPGSFSVFAH